MFKSFYLFLFVLLMPLTGVAQEECYCCKKQSSGQKEYDAGQYKAAIQEWKRGQNTSDPEKCPKLATLILKAEKELQKPQPKLPLDSDEDGIPDPDDVCPNLYGPKLFKGCPDRDRDEIPDYQDKCPDILGPYRTRGCPDRDGDGVADRDDDCPDQTGVISNNGCPKKDLAFIKGGVFQMGDVMGDNLSQDETVHTVSVDDFYISKFEVTFVEYDTFCKATNKIRPSDNQWGRGDRPVINVDWYDAVEYCIWLSTLEGLTPCYSIDKNIQDSNNTNDSDTKKWIVRCNWNTNGYRLPTEAEWEFAGRSASTSTGEFQGGAKVRFCNSRDIIVPLESNFDGKNVNKKAFALTGKYRKQTISVKGLSANVFEIKNMSGNVWEWCWDWYGENYYFEGVNSRNPRGPAKGSFRVLRGGSWESNPEYCRASVRSKLNPSGRNNMRGFRVVRSH